MTENTSTPTQFLASIQDHQRREDCGKIYALMKKASGWTARMWGPCVIGFSSYKYRYPSGRSGESFRIGFANRKNQITLYVLWHPTKDDPLLAALGTHKIGKGCLFIKNLSDIDESILEQIIKRAVAEFDNRQDSLT